MDRFGGGADAVTVPITIPVDRAGIVVVSAAPPELADPTATRRPARLTVSRAGKTLAIELAFSDGRELRLPGVGGPVPVPLGSIAFDVTTAGLAVVATTPDGDPTDVEVDEAAARQLSTALLLTFRVKLTRADRDQQEA